MTKVIMREELDRRFTEAVTRYMSRGLFIATASMCGHQGEDGKLDLTDGKVTYRILAYRTCRGFKNDVYIIEVRKYDEYVRSSMGNVLWNEKGELIETVCKVYRIDRWGEGVYVETEEEAKAIGALQLERYRKNDDAPWKTLNSFDAETVLKAVKNRRGYKRTKASDIVRVERRCDKAQYRIEIEGKASLLIG